MATTYAPTVAMPQAQYKVDPSSESFGEYLTTTLRSIPHLPAALAFGTDQEGITDEERELRKRALAEGARFVVPLVVGGGAGVALRSATGLAPMITRILSGAIGAGAGEGAWASILGLENPMGEAAKGAAIGGAFGAAGEFATRGFVAAKEASKRLAAEQIGEGEVKRLAARALRDTDAVKSMAAELPQVRSYGEIPVNDIINKGSGSLNLSVRRDGTVFFHAPGQSPVPEESLIGSGQIGVIRNSDPKAKDLLIFDEANSLVRGTGPVARHVRAALKNADVTVPRNSILRVEHTLPGGDISKLNVPLGQIRPEILKGPDVFEVLKKAEAVGIEPRTVFRTLDIPENKWDMFRPFSTSNTQAQAKVVEAMGDIPTGTNIMFDAPPARRSPFSSMVSSPRQVVPPETAPLEAAVKTANSAFVDKALNVTPTGVKQLMNNATLLFYRALAPASATLSKMGPTGRKLAGEMQEVFTEWRLGAGENMQKVSSILEPFTKIERIHIGEVMEGIAAPRNDTYAAAAQRLGEVYGDYAERSSELGMRTLSGNAPREFMRRQNYMTHYLDPKDLAKLQDPSTQEYKSAIAELIRQGEASNVQEARHLLRQFTKHPAEFKTGPINFSRTRALESLFKYEKDPLKVMGRYIYDVERRLQVAKRFGHDNKGIEQTLVGIHDEAGDEALQSAKNIFNYFVDGADRSYSPLVKAVTTYNTLSMLSTSGIVQPAQLLNTISKVGWGNTIKGIGAMLDKGSRQWSEGAGVALRETLDDAFGLSRDDLGTKWVRMIGLEKFDKTNRVVSGLAGRFYAEEVAKKYAIKPTERLAEQLNKMGINPMDVANQNGVLSNQQLRKAALHVANDTQFASSVLDLPELKNTLGGRLVYQFKAFALQQTNFMGREILDPMYAYFKTGGKRGSLAPLMRFASAIGPAGYIIGNLVRTVKGRTAPDDPTLKMIENMAMVGAFGVYYDTFTSMAGGPGQVLSLFAGPTGGEMARLMGSDIPSLTKGDPSALARHAVSRIPGIGQPLANYWLFPKESQ